MRVLQVYLILAWILLAIVTGYAIADSGLQGGNVFLTDFEHPWRAQFNTDFCLYAVLFGAWVLWREPSKLVGLACALGSLAGGLFALLYVAVASFRAQGDIRRLLLGAHWQADAPRAKT